ncbi:MAG: Peptide/nickel transport system permease protein [Ilumatobacteraceae bacterium]|nr:Peptide/nickel transport system permease protein [Ilumatobacteraceae bacterium]
MTALPPIALPVVVEPRTRRGRGRRPAWRRGPALVGLVVLALWVLVALTLPLWTPFGPLDPVDKRLLSPNAHHWLGTDALGRDVFTRVLWGARTSLPVAAIVILAAVIIGTIIGAVSGFFGGWIDAVLMRFVDITMAFPPILLAMAITASLGPSIRNAVIAMILVWWPIYARLLRAQVIAVRQRDFVDSAVAIGASRWLILRRYVLPMSYTPVLVNATMDFGQVVLLVASLSFIGLGARPPSPEWGAMITEGATNFYQWWIAAGPGLAILLVVLAFNFVGDGLRDTFDVRDDS